MLTNHSLSQLGRRTVGYNMRFNRRSVTPQRLKITAHPRNYYSTVYTDHFRATGLHALPPGLPPAPPGYQWVWEPDGLSGLGGFSLKKIFKSVTSAVKKVVKVAGKVVKKVAPVALVAAGVYYSAPWFLKVAKTVGTAAANLLLQQAPEGEISEEQANVEAASGEPPAWIQAGLQAILAKQQADAALKLQREQGEAQYQAAVEANRQAVEQQRLQQEMARQTVIQQQQQQRAAQATPGLPQWLLPAAIGGAALLLTLKS